MDAEVKTLADNAARTKDELELKLNASEQKAGATETSLAQATAEREKLLAQLDEERKKLELKDAEIKTLADNAARTKDELELKLNASEQKAVATEATLAQAAAEREKILVQLDEEKKKHELRTLRIKTLSDNATRTKDELELKLTTSEQKAGATETTLAQSTAEREKLLAQLDEEKKKLDS